MDKNDPVAKVIQELVLKAIEGAFQDSIFFGTGYIKVEESVSGLNVRHIPFMDMEQELEKIQEITRYRT